MSGWIFTLDASSNLPTGSKASTRSAKESLPLI
jgi:hypothetical protein